MKDFEKTETEVTLTHNFRMNCDPADSRKVRVVFVRESYEVMEDNVEENTSISMEDELDSRIYSFFNCKPKVRGGAGFIGWNGVKSVIYLDIVNKKKETRPPKLL